MPNGAPVHHKRQSYAPWRGTCFTIRNEESAVISRRNTLLLPLLAVPHVARAETLRAGDGDMSGLLQSAIDTAQGKSGVVQLGAGTFRCSNLRISENILIVGVPGRTVLRLTADDTLLRISAASLVTLQGLDFAAKGISGQLVAAETVASLRIEDCSFAGGGIGLTTRRCGGHIQNNRFSFHQATGLHCTDSRYMQVTGNTLTDIGNNAIRVWRSEKGEDGTIVTGNQIARIAAEDGGDGPHGNGISVYKAGNVVIANNRISDCAFSAIRNNSGDGAVITSNSISRCNEVGLYVEFGFLGAIVANNILENVAHGISITNFNEGGRLAICDGNIVRGARGLDAHGEPLGGGISAQAETVVSNNLVEEADGTGILLGWGPYGRNLTAQGNTLRKTRRAIAFSAVADGPFLIANNLISGTKQGAVLAMDHDKVVSGDLSLPGAKLPKSLSLHGNEVDTG
jgi:uncharacterized secreted repeat protein (TIGR03808 family)